MIKIIPWIDRKLSKKSLAKIWNLFPNDEICMIELNTEYEKFQWAKSIARYYVSRGKEFSIEIDPIKYIEQVEQFLKIGVKKFYFPWLGLYDNMFYSSMDIVSYSINIVERYPDVQVCVVYTPPYNSLNYKPDMTWLETSIDFLSYSTKEYKNVFGRLRRPHPWFGDNRMNCMTELENKISSLPRFDVENWCGCLTIDSNTNIYCCPFCNRKRKKKNFGNADRDKFVCGTIDRGVFRTIICKSCNYSRDAQKGKISYI